MRMKRRGIPDITALTSTRRWEREPLVEQGKLPHETSLPFRRNVLSIARSVHAAGAEMALMTMPLREKRTDSGEITRKFGVGEHNDHLRELAATEGCLLVDAAAYFDTRPELQAEFLDGVHVTPEGNQVKARLIADVLLERWVPGLSTDGARPPSK
jgi:lysophospholipase L1-like esterase